MEPDQELLSARINLDTGRIAWEELQRHFARGVVVKVAAGLDLVEAASAMARDESDQVRVWLASGQLARAETADAIAWNERQARFWAVVVAPWVLVQEDQ